MPLQQNNVQSKQPKYVIAVGSCALSCGVFYDAYNAYGPVDQVIPVDMYIPGCPTRPGAILAGLEKLLIDQNLCAAAGSQDVLSVTNYQN